MSGGNRRTRGRTERWLPLTYFAAALILTLVALPTVLRPTPPEQNQTAELSPDAPPDDEQQSIIATLNRPVSGTAGDGVGEGEGEGAPVTVPPPVQSAPRGCPRGIGNPPRQTFSLYSAPCALAFTGDNGGATWRGVSSTEVRIAVGEEWWGGTEGPVDPPSPSQSAEDRTISNIQQWFNLNYQFWGRQLRLWHVKGSDDITLQPAIAAWIDDEVGAFAAVHGRPELQRDLARRGIISIAGLRDQYDRALYEENRPYIWGWRPDATEMRALTAEYVCRRLWERPAAHAGDANMQVRPRKLGLVYVDGPGWKGALSEMTAFLEAQCGASLTAIAFHSDSGGTNDGTAYYATAVARLQQDGVTTVLMGLNYYGNVLSLLTSASTAGYSPEWVVTGFGEIDQAAYARFMPASQWGNAFGISARELEEQFGSSALAGGASGPIQEQDCHRAIAEIDPSFAPDGEICVDLFPRLMQIANGIQMAGPNLTPTSFEEGLFRIGRRSADPVWSIGGGYAPGRHSYANAVGEIWWDPSTTDSVGNVGVYRWTNGGRKWTLGNIPADTAEVKKSGIAVRGEVAEAS